MKNKRRILPFIGAWSINIRRRSSKEQSACFFSTLDLCRRMAAEWRLKSKITLKAIKNLKNLLKIYSFYANLLTRKNKKCKISDNGCQYAKMTYWFPECCNADTEMLYKCYSFMLILQSTRFFVSNFTVVLQLQKVHWRRQILVL